MYYFSFSCSASPRNINFVPNTLKILFHDFPSFVLLRSCRNFSPCFSFSFSLTVLRRRISNEFFFLAVNGPFCVFVFFRGMGVYKIILSRLRALQFVNSTTQRWKTRLERKIGRNVVCMVLFVRFSTHEEMHDTRDYPRWRTKSVIIQDMNKRMESYANSRQSSMSDVYIKVQPRLLLIKRQCRGKVFHHLPIRRENLRGILARKI